MLRLHAFLLVLLAVLAVAVAIAAGRLAARYEQDSGVRSEWSRTKLTQLSPGMREHLAVHGDELVFTYYVSARARMPSGMKRIERDVTDLLGALRAAAPERVGVHMVDPDTDPRQKGYASNRRITPFRVRDVAHDAWSERLVWSTLTMAWGARDEVVINGLTPERLPRLQATLLEHLERLERPRRPAIALAAPPGFDQLAHALREHGEVARVDLDGGAPYPSGADVLFWMQPRSVTPERLREVDQALQAGKSVVVAGSLLRSSPGGLAEVAADGGSEPGLRVEPSGQDFEPLLAHFGLRPEPTLVLDASSGVLAPLDAPEERLQAPFLVRCIAPNQSFLTWRNQPNGHLFFHLPAPLRLDPDLLRERGLEARVHATTSDDTWLQPPPFDAPRPFSALSVEHGDPTTKVPLLVSLEPSDPWHGRLVALGASTPFEDGQYGRPESAHGRLLLTLVDELASPERLVAAATAGVGASAPAPELGGGARLAWRALVIGLPPALLVLLALARGELRQRAGSRGRAGAAPRQIPGAVSTRGIAPRAGFAIVLALAATAVAAWPRLAIDATGEGLNRLADETRAIARRAGAAGPIRVELFFSERAQLPPALRGRPREVRAQLEEFRRAGADLDVERVDVGVLDETGRDGVLPVRVVTRDEEVTTIRTIYSALRLSRGDRVEVLPFEDAAAFEFLEFRLAFALWRLETGRSVKIAFAADAERMSAAEDYDLQQQGLFAPKGNDPYSLARGLLFRLDFEVVNVTPRRFFERAPDVPDDADLVVWLQPRRSIEAMMEETVRYLVGGGNVLIAAQHFRILSRQYRGREFQMSYWPRPQTPDVDRIYLPDIGVHLVRDVLFDQLHVETTVDTEVIGRSGGRDYERQLSTRPFQLRVSAAGHDPESAITRDLGDQAFLWASRIELDRERLLELGLDARVLMTTTERAWTYPWKGGFLEEPDEGREHLSGPPLGPDGRPAYLGPVPLAVEVQGRFPRPEKALSLDGFPESRPGRLVLIGCSSAFQDERLHLPEFRADRLLLNAVADLALEPELAAIATRHATVRGFGYVEPERKLRWRAIVLAAPPAAILFLALGVILARRRAPARRMA